MFRVNQPGVGWFEVSCKVDGFYVVSFVVNGVEDPPAFIVRFPVNYNADGAVNGGVGNEVGDGNGVAFLDVLLRFVERGGFESGVGALCWACSLLPCSLLPCPLATASAGTTW